MACCVVAQASRVSGITQTQLFLHRCPRTLLQPHHNAFLMLVDRRLISNKTNRLRGDLSCSLRGRREGTALILGMPL